MAFIVALAAPSLSTPVISTGAVTPNSVVINLATPSKSSAAAGISGYQLWRYDTAGAPDPSAIFSVSTFPYTVSGLNPSQTYYFRALALENVGNNYSSQLSNTLVVPTGSISVPPPQVTWLSNPTALNSSQISMSWNAASGATSYNLERNGAVIQTGLTATSFTDNGLLASTTYTYNVAGVNAAGIGPYSVSQSATTAAKTGAQTASGTNSSLFAYIQTLGANAGGVLTGQFGQPYDSNLLSNITPIQTQTGVLPAILGAYFAEPGQTLTPEQNATYLANWVAAGGIAMAMWRPHDPSTGGDPSTNNPGIFPNVYTPGNSVNTTFNSYIDRVSNNLKAVNGSVLFRPFPELNGGWQWYGAINTAQFIALWQYTFNRIVKTNGVTNALFMFNINAGVGNYTQYYPGTNFVDIVSCDDYPPSSNSISQWYNPLLTFGKPIMLGETGGSASNFNAATNTYDNSTISSFVVANMQKIFAIPIWCQGLSIDNQKGAQAFMTGPHMLNRSQIPVGSNL